MLVCKTRLWVHRQLPRSWSRTIILVGQIYDGGHEGRFQVVLISSLYLPEGESREGGGDDVVGHTEEGVLSIMLVCGFCLEN